MRDVIILSTYYICIHLGLDCLHQKERLINAEECASIGETHLGDSLRLELVTSSILAKDDHKGLDKSRRICDICKHYGLLWTVDIQNLRGVSQNSLCVFTLIYRSMLFINLNLPRPMCFIQYGTNIKPFLKLLC